MQIREPAATPINNNEHQDSTVLGNINKDELVRLMLQSLIDLGYTDTAFALQTESQVALESDIIHEFRNSVLQGDWSLCEQLLVKVPFIQSASQSDYAQVKFLLREQRFLELLEQRKLMKALYVLRNELTPLCQNTDRLHQLSSLMVCSTAEEVLAQAQWDGTEGTSRQQLLVELQKYIEPSAMIPKGRLVTLINQAEKWQQHECLYHNSSTDTSFSLFADHTCDKTLFPTNVIKILKGHTDEVWHISYSHDGKYLASLSKDKTGIIWNMETFEQIQSFETEVSSSYCAWSPDDSKLLVCGTDFSLRLWDPHSGVLLTKFSHHKEQVTSCVWLPDGEHFISGACDKRLCLWNVDETLPVSHWPVHRITDMKISQDGQRFVTIGLDRCISIYQVEGLRINPVAQIEQDGMITSLSLTKNGRFALVNIQETQEIHLWDLDKQQLVHTYSGQKQASYIIRSTFGGANESFVLSGSEDSKIYIWSRDHEEVLEVLEGHTSTVNCVCWCPIEPMQFVSASDDYTIRIWA